MPSFSPWQGSRSGLVAAARSGLGRVAAASAAEPSKLVWRKRRRLIVSELFTTSFLRLKMKLELFWSFLLAIYALHLHAQAVQPFAGGDKQRLPILSAETNIARPGLRNVNLLDLLALGIEHRYAFS